VKKLERQKLMKRIRSGQRWGADALVGEMQRRDNAAMAAQAEESLDNLLCLGEVMDRDTNLARKAVNFVEEETSIRRFAAVLEIQIAEGETLLQLLAHVYKAWVDAGQPLLNPYSEKFSADWITNEKPKSLAAAWHFIPPLDAYNVPLVIPTAPQKGGAAVAIPKEEILPPNEFPTFSAQVGSGTQD
jgi:hypothetical protein